MRIGELGSKTGLSAKTIRYYEGIGLLPEPRRTASGYRDYDEKAKGRLEFIRAAQSVGLSLGEIREVLALRDLGRPACGHVTQLIEQRAEEISSRIGALEKMREDLVRLAKRARRLGEKPGPHGYCHIIESQIPQASRKGAVA